MHSLFKLAETTILYSVQLSNALSNFNLPVRIVRAYNICVRDRVRSTSDRMIDSLVMYISAHPHYISEWTDNYLLCLVAYVNNHEMLLNNSDKYITNMASLIDNVETIAYVVYIICKSIVYFDYRKFASMLVRMREELSYSQYRDLVMCITNTCPRIVTRYDYLNHMWRLTKPDMQRMYRSAVFACGSVGHVPSEFMDYEMCTIAAYNCEISLIPDHMYDANICMLITKMHPCNIRLLPSYMISQSLCDIAVENDPYSILCIPLQFITENMMRSAIMTNPEILGFLVQDIEQVPSFIIAKVCSILPQIRPDFIKSVLLDLIIHTYKYYTYVSSLYSNIDIALTERVKTMLMHIDSALPLLYYNHKLVGYILTARELQSVMWRMDVPSKYNILRYINQNLRDEVFTQDMCEYLYKKSVLTIKFIPAKRLTKDMWLHAIDSVPRLAIYAPRSVLTYKVCAAAIKSCPLILTNSVFIEKLAHIENFHELIHVGLLEQPSIFENIPIELTQDMCELIITVRPNSICMIPKKFKTDLMLHNLIKLGWTSLTLETRTSILLSLPSHMRSLEIYVNSVSSHYKLIQYVPEEYFDKTVQTVVLLKLNENDIDFIDNLINKFCDSPGSIYQKLIYNIWNLISDEDWRTLIIHFPHNIRLAPTRCLTPDVCMVAVEYDEYMIKYIPAHLRTNRMATKLYTNFTFLSTSLRKELIYNFK